MKRGRSILQPDMTRNDRECFITGRTDKLQRHHIYPGPNRKISDRMGFWVWLTQDLHNGNDPRAVHNDPNGELDAWLKRLCQLIYEKTHTREDFLKLIGKSYL